MLPFRLVKAIIQTHRFVVSIFWVGGRPNHAVWGLGSIFVLRASGLYTLGQKSASLAHVQNIYVIYLSGILQALLLLIFAN